MFRFLESQCSSGGEKAGTDRGLHHVFRFLESQLKLLMYRMWWAVQEGRRWADRQRASPRAGSLAIVSMAALHAYVLS